MSFYRLNAQLQTESGSEVQPELAGTSLHQRGLLSSHLLAIAKHSLGRFPGASWRPPCKNKKPCYQYNPCVNHRTNLTKVNRSRKFEIEKRQTFTVAKVRLLAYLIVNLAKKKKKCEFFISSSKNATGERTKEIASAPSIKT